MSGEIMTFCNSFTLAGAIVFAAFCAACVWVLR